VKPNSLRLDLQIYPHKVDIQARYADVDPQWHLNNVRIVELYQEGRISFNRMISKEFEMLYEQGHRILVARQSIDYLLEVKWPGTVTIGAGVIRVGGASFSLGLAMFQHGKCVGVSDAVLVYVFQQGPTRIPEGLREVRERRMLPTIA